MKFYQKFCGFSFTALALLFASSCNNSSNQLNYEDDKDDSSAVVVSNDVVDMIQNVSSPVEMANEIKSTGVNFEQGVLNAAGRESDYETSFKKATNLGVYAADLGYINTFNKNMVVVEYLSSISRLANGIGVGQFLDIATLSNLAKNSTNLDSLKQLSVNSFNQIDKYLREQNRSNVSSAIVLGTWIEGLYLTSTVIEKTNDKGLSDRLAEQKDIVDIIQIVVNCYSSDADFKTIGQYISELKTLFKDIRITSEMGEPEVVVIDDQLQIIQNAKTTVECTPEQISAVIAKIKEIRNYIIK